MLFRSVSAQNKVEALVEILEKDRDLTLVILGLLLPVVSVAALPHFGRLDGRLVIPIEQIRVQLGLDRSLPQQFGGRGGGSGRGTP